MSRSHRWCIFFNTLNCRYQDVNKMLWYCGKVKEIVFISLGIKDIFILTASLGITETYFLVSEES